MQIFRNRSPRRRRLDAAVLLVGSVVFAVYNVFFVIRGLHTGAIKSLQRGSRTQVRLDVEPGWYVFNMAVRIALLIVLLWVIHLAWKQLREAFKRGG